MFFGRIAANDKIKPAQVNDMLINKEDFILIDVRTQGEYVSGHIKGSQLLPLDMLVNGAEKMIPDKNKKIVVYCQSGARSSQAAKIFTQLGYADVSNLGGIMSWPFGVVSGR